MPRIDGTDEQSQGALTLLEQGRPLADLEALASPGTRPRSFLASGPFWRPPSPT